MSVSGCFSKPLIAASGHHDDLALRRALEHIDAAHERGFAGTAHADDAVDVAVRNGQGDILERVYPSAGCFKGFA